MFVNPTSAALTWRWSWNQKKDLPFPNKWSLKVLECACTCCACTASDYSAAQAEAHVAALAGARVAAQHLYQNHHKLPGSPGPGEMMQSWNVMLLPVLSPCVAFSPSWALWIMGRLWPQKCWMVFFFVFFNFPLLWRQRIDFYPDFYPAYSIFTLQAFWPTNTRAFAQKCPFVFPLGTFLYYYYF